MDVETDTDEENADGEAGSQEDADGEPEPEDRRTSVKDIKLPETTVVKLMKEHLPKQAIIAQESKDAMRRLACIFALFITDHALEVARRSKRRTLLPEDVVVALHENHFGAFTEQVMPVVEKRRANFRSRKSKEAFSDKTTPAHLNGVNHGQRRGSQPNCYASGKDQNQSTDSESGDSEEDSDVKNSDEDDDKTVAEISVRGHYDDSSTNLFSSTIQEELDRD